MNATVQSHLVVDAELQVDQVRAADAAEALVVVRCIRGPVRLGARFRRIRDTATPINLELARILVYERRVDEIGPGQTALVTLRGDGVPQLRPGDRTSGWQIILGTNPQHTAPDDTGA